MRSSEEREVGSGLPTDAAQVDRGVVGRLLRTSDPDVVIDGVEVVGAWTFDEQGGGQVYSVGLWFLLQRG